jgi:hypothetical protein
MAEFIVSYRAVYEGRSRIMADDRQEAFEEVQRDLSERHKDATLMELVTNDQTTLYGIDSNAVAKVLTSIELHCEKGEVDIAGQFNQPRGYTCRELSRPEEKWCGPCQLADAAGLDVYFRG